MTLTISGRVSPAENCTMQDKTETNAHPTMEHGGCMKLMLYLFTCFRCTYFIM